MHGHAPSNKASAAKVSVIASLVTTSVKFVVALATGSLGVLSEALHSLIDLAATVLTWFAVRLADEPADDEHHFGHAKIENLSALVEAVLLVGTAVFVAYEAIIHLLNGSAAVLTQWWAFVLIGGGIAVDLWRSGVLRKVAKAESSAALAADAAHFEVDIYASVAVLVGLTGAALGYPKMDSIAALLVSGLIFWMGLKLGREAVAVLLDRAPSGATELLRETLFQEPSVLGVEALRVRQVGAVPYVSFNASVPRSLATSEISSLSQRLKSRVQAALPGADVSVALEPVALLSETVQQKIIAIADQHALSIHHLVVQDVGSKRAVSFDVEMMPSLPLGLAHEKATELEDAIRAGLGGELEVESHIEPKPDDSLASVQASKLVFAKVLRALNTAARGERHLTDIHNVRVRRMGRSLYLHYHCRFAPTLSLEACHAVLDRVEAKMMAKVPLLKRVIAHAEPIGRAKHRL